MMFLCLSWGLTLTQNTIHTTSDLDRSRLTDTRSAEKDRIGTDTDTDASLVIMCFTTFKLVLWYHVYISNSAVYMPSKKFSVGHFWAICAGSRYKLCPIDAGLSESNGALCKRQKVSCQHFHQRRADLHSWHRAPAKHTFSSFPTFPNIHVKELFTI